LVKRDSERRKIHQIEVIGTEEKFLLQMSSKNRFVVAVFDEKNAMRLKKELDEWLTEKIGK
jgi:hypothetical protein